jgi:uncharacterized membrane protein YfcA
MLEVALLLIGVLVGMIGTIVGAGGGFLLVPIMLFLYPEEHPATITTISLAVVLVNGLSGSLAYARQRRIDYRTAWTLALANIPGSILGTLVVNGIERGPFILVFSAIMIAVAAMLGLRPTPRARLSGSGRRMARRLLVDRAGNRYEYTFPLVPSFIISLVIGFLSALLGVGGGIFQVPIFILLLGFPAHIATATSSLMLIATSLTSTVTHILAGDLPDALRRIVILSPGVVLGAQIGAQIGRRARPQLIARLLATAMLLSAVRLLWGQFL